MRSQTKSRGPLQLTKPKTLEESEDIPPLTAEDYKLLKKSYFLRWTLYKGILIGFGLIFLAAWFLLSWLVYFSKPPVTVDQDSFLFLSYLIGGMGLLTGVITQLYRKRVAMVLMQDCREGRKVRKVGHIVEIKSAGRYSTQLVFKTKNSSEVKDFIIQHPRPHFSYDDLIPGREIILEYTPHFRQLLVLSSSIPLTLEEKKQLRSRQWTGFIRVSLLINIVNVSAGWFFERLLESLVVYIVFLAIFICIIVWDGGVEKQNE